MTAAVDPGPGPGGDDPADEAADQAAMPGSTRASGVDGSGGPPRKPHVDPATFFALDLRVGRVVSVREFQKARKPAYRVKVDFGPQVGVLETSAQVTRYPASELEGRLVVAVVNIGRKNIAGLWSEFLMLGALDPDGTVRLLQPEPESPPGAPVA